MGQEQRIPLPDPRRLRREEMLARARQFAEEMSWRRSVRDFSGEPVDFDIIERCLAAALRAPSGANQQPWHFVVVGRPDVKARIRQAAEAEEKRFYEQRAPRDWLEALQPLGTDWRKPFLERAPYLIAIFVQIYGLDPEGERIKHYYAQESVGIATGILIAGLHRAGLATLTHTPSPMGFLNEILQRPPNERPFLLLVVGEAAEGTTVPAIERKPRNQVLTVL